MRTLALVAPVASIAFVAALSGCQQPTVTSTGCDGVREIVGENCVSCHSGAAPAGALPMVPGNIEVIHDWIADGAQCDGVDAGP